MNRNQWADMESVARGEPLGPVRLNQTHANCRTLDDLMRVQHFADGQHNALEVPWVLGHVDGTTGYLFDTAYGGGTITNPATGRYAVSVASGVFDATEQDVAMLANVADAAIEAKPHIITWAINSATSAFVRIRELSSALGAGNSWASVDRDFDFALFAPAQDAEASELLPNLNKTRRDFLTDVATDWNALVENQAIAHATATLEHEATGLHSVNRIAKATWWGRPSAGPSFTTTLAQGVDSISYVGTGVVELTTTETFASAAHIAVFPQANPATANERVIVNGRGFNTNKVRLYTYAFDGTNWARADRSLFCAIYGER